MLSIQQDKMEKEDYLDRLKDYRTYLINARQGYLNLKERGEGDRLTDNTIYVYNKVIDGLEGLFPELLEDPKKD